MEKVKTTPIAEKLEQKKQEILSNAKDEALTASLLDEILSLKAQECIEPTELHVPVKDVVETMDMGAICFKICKTGILFHAKSGYTVWISARCRSLFEQLTELFGYLKKFDNLSQEDKQKEEEAYRNAQSMLDAYCHLFQSPIASSVMPLVLFRTASTYLEAFKEESDRILSQPLAEETLKEIEKNIQSEQAEEVLDAMASQIKD